MFSRILEIFLNLFISTSKEKVFFYLGNQHVTLAQTYNPLAPPLSRNAHGELWAVSKNIFKFSATETRLQSVFDHVQSN